MNIAILIHALAGGGAERVAQVIGNYYVDKGNKVYYFLADTDIKQDYAVKGEVIRTDVKTNICGGCSGIPALIRLFAASLKIRSLKIRYKIDVSISFMEEANYLNVLSKGRDRVVTRICTILSERDDCKGFLYQERVVSFFYSMADTVVVMSRYALMDMVCHYRIPPRNMVRIPNPAVDLKIQECEKPWAFGTKAVLCVGRLEPVKQQERIIRAFSCMCRAEPDAKLVILGKGPQLKYLKSISKKLNVEDRVFFEGFKDNITHYLEHARAFVMASKVEGFPNSMIEAMNCGVPIITTDSPGACGEIVGKPKDLAKIKSLTFCRYGILTPDIPGGKLKWDSPLTEHETILGEAMLKVLNEDKIYRKYRVQSFKRADMFRMEKVIRKWNGIIGTGHS